MNVPRKIHQLLLLLTLSMVLLLSEPASSRANDPLPPFFYIITPAHSNGRITYDIKFSGLVEWTMMDVTFKIPLPVGTRYVDGGAPASTTVQLEGNEVVFFTSVFHKPLKGVFFTVEITDPAKTVFDTRVSFEWKGEHPGNYLSENISLDITKEPLKWSKPNHRLNLGFSAMVGDDDTITYTIYPESLSSIRMWDLKLNIPLPVGTTYLSATVPPQFVASSDGKVVYFTVSELPSMTNLGALSFKVSTTAVPNNQLLSTRIWASWKNSGRGVGVWDIMEENLTSGEVIVQPRVLQHVIADMIGDVPLANYDVTSLALQDNGTVLKVIFYLMGEIKPTDPLNFSLFIDRDCRTDTGQLKDGRGVEYRIMAQPETGQARFIPLDLQQDRWLNAEATTIATKIEGKTVAMLVPYSLLGNSRRFCWVGQARNETKNFTPDPPTEKIPDMNLPILTQYQTTTKAELAAQLDAALNQKQIVLVPLGGLPKKVESTVTSTPKVSPSSLNEGDSATPTPKPSQNRGDSEGTEPTKPIESTKQPNEGESKNGQERGESQTSLTEDDFIKLGDIWQYQPGWAAPPSNWAKKDFDDSKWYTGATSIGYGDGKFTTDLSLSLSQIQQVEASNAEEPASPPKALPGGPPLTDFASIFMRSGFSINQPDGLSKLTLHIDYEDGFVIYINGVEAARRGLKAIGTPLSFDTPATDRNGGMFEDIDLSEMISKLVSGHNMIAIEVHRSLERSNIFIAPELTWERGTAITPKVTVTPEQSPQPKAEQSSTETPAPKETAPAPKVAESAPPTVAATPKGEAVPVPEKKEEKKAPLPRIGGGQGGDGSIYVPEMVAVIPKTGATALPATALPATALPPPPVDSQTLPPLPVVPMPKTDFGLPNPNPSIIDTHGKIAIPVDNGHGFYDVRIFALRFGYGWELKIVKNGRQPNISPDGQRMLINREGEGGDAIFEYNFADGSQRPVSENRLDSHPFYDPWGNRLTFDNPALLVDAQGIPHAHLAVQCGVKLPSQESDPRCQNVATFGIIVPSGQMGPIEGTHPIWANNDMIVYQGCDSWLGGSACGIYAVGSWATKGFSDGAIPTQLTHDTSDIPGDTKGNYILFTSRRDGNWEVYLMGLDGNGMRNLSNNPQSNDGLPTISPDGNWVGFVSDRDGHWAVWAAPLAGGTAQKLFDFPVPNPWSTGERDWTNERISWGP